MTGTGPAGRAVRNDVAPGRVALCLGPPMVGKVAFLEQFVAERLTDGDVVVLVETDPGSFDLESILDGVETDPRLAVVTLDGTRSRPAELTAWETVGSPGDLTGLGMATIDRLRPLDDRPPDVGLWVVLDSINTVDAYTDFDRLYQFLNALTTHITEAGGRGLFTLYENALDGESVAAIETLFDRRVEFEATDGERRLRLVTPDGAGPWHGLDTARREPGAPPSRPAAEVTSVPDSLAAAHDRLRAADQRLTVYDAEQTDVEALVPFFERYGVEVGTARSEPDRGLRPFALLDREGDPLAVSPFRELRTVVELDREGDRPALDVRPDVLEHLDRSVFGTRGATRRELVRVSRNFELAALRAGDGVLRAGFQRLSRFGADDDTAALYRRLVDAGVEVHLYGAPDEAVTLEGAVVHGEDAAEVADSWFVVYDGGGDPLRSGTLLCLEQRDGQFDGAWTHDASFAAALDSYLADAYPVSPAPA